MAGSILTDCGGLKKKNGRAQLVLADGTRFEGIAFGAPPSRNLALGEVVFNTAMTGYQEILTDPSYRGQLVCLTYPLIGNYGITPEDVESRRAFLSGLIVRELSRVVSNWRASTSLDNYLKQQRVSGIQGVDTRALTLHLRDKGAMSGLITSQSLTKPQLRKLFTENGGLMGVDLVKEVVLKRSYQWNRRGKFKVVAIDTGIKYNILRLLEQLGCKITVMPPSTSLEAILKERPSGVFLANGPGDPEAVPYLVATVKQLIGRVPIFGICMGHQVLAQALGGRTFKLPFGHHGANHPVKDLNSGRVEITSQNHGFAVDPASLPAGVIQTHVNLNDQTCEGLKHSSLPIFSVQYHPEAAPGPHDSRYLFKRFLQQMQRRPKAKASA